MLVPLEAPSRDVTFGNDPLGEWQKKRGLYLKSLGVTDKALNDFDTKRTVLLNELYALLSQGKKLTYTAYQALNGAETGERNPDQFVLKQLNDEAKRWYEESQFIQKELMVIDKMRNGRV